MQAQGKWVPGDEQRQYERLIQQLNNKAESFLSIYMDTVHTVPYVLQRFPVSPLSTMFLWALYVDAEVAGAGGANGLTLRFSGGGWVGATANLDLNVLPVAATQSSITQTSFSSGNVLYQVPSSGVLQVQAFADDHAATPERIHITVGVRVV